MTGDAIDHLIALAYDAALDERLWPVLGDAIPRAFDTTGLGVALVNNAGTEAQFLMRSPNFTPERVHEYSVHYNRLDLWAQRVKALGPLGLSKVWLSQEMVPDTEFQHSEVFNDYCRHIEIAHCVGCVWPVSSDLSCVFGILGSQSRGAFDYDDKRQAERLVPHLQRALEIRQRLAHIDTQRHAAVDALERAGTAVLVVARDGRIIYANSEAETTLREADAIRAQDGRLSSVDRLITKQLMRLIYASIDAAADRGGAAGGALKVPRGDRLPMTVLVAPFRPARDGFGAPAPAAILFVKDPESSSMASTALQGLFGLTPAESGIAAALTNGEAIGEIAGTLGISVNTARTQLKSILAKTGTRRQAELVSVLLRSVAPMIRR